MNGRDLTLGLVAGLAVGAALGRRGSRSVHRVYHLTYSSDLPSIARHGLAPRPDTQASWDNEPGVYFVNTFGYRAGAPESEEPAWLRLPAPPELPASFWESLQEGRTRAPFPPDTIEVWVDAKGRPAAFADGVAWKPLREVASTEKRDRTVARISAWSHDEGDQGTGEEIVGTLNQDPVGSIYVFSSATSLNTVLRREGYTTFSHLPRGKVGWLGAIELPEDARGAGLGAKIVNAMMREARRLGVRSVVLHADSGRSRRFWERMGFVEAPMREKDLRKSLWMTPMTRTLEAR